MNPMMNERVQEADGSLSMTYVGHEEKMDMVPSFQTLTLKEGELVAKKESKVSTLFSISVFLSCGWPHPMREAARAIAYKRFFFIV